MRLIDILNIMNKNTLLWNGFQAYSVADLLEKKEILIGDDLYKEAVITHDKNIHIVDDIERMQGEPYLKPYCLKNELIKVEDRMLDEAENVTVMWTEEEKDHYGICGVYRGERLKEKNIPVRITHWRYLSDPPEKEVANNSKDKI